MSAFFISLRDLIAHFLSQGTPAIILALMIFELVSFMVSPHPLSKLTLHTKRLFRFADPWHSITTFLWLLLAVWSILYPRNISPISPSFLTAGMFLFLLGWLIRYQPDMFHRLSKRSRRIRPLLSDYWKSWSKLQISGANATLFAPSLEIIGLTVIARSLAFIPAFFLLPIVLIAGMLRESRKLAHVNPNVTPLTLKDIFPKLGHIALFFAIPSVAGLVIGLAVREYSIFNADVETAKSVLFTLSQIEGSIGILAITVIFVLTQLTAANYSTRIPAILFRQPAFWIPLLVLLTSIMYNLLIASNAPTTFPTGYFRSGLIDFSFIFAVASACGITYFIFKAPRTVSPESIIADSLKRFDKKWLDTIKRDWCRPNFEIKLNVVHDPFIVIERILSRAVDSGDNLTFISGLILIRDHLHQISQLDPRELPNYMMEFDAYLRHHFRSLVRTAAKNSDAYSLLQLVNFIRELDAPSSESIVKCDTFAYDYDDAAGELLLREIVRQALEFHLSECVTRAVNIVEARAVSVLKTLPDQTGTWLYDKMTTDPAISKQEYDRLWANDRRVESFERNYLTYLQHLGVNSADSALTEVSTSVVLTLNQLASSIAQEVKGIRMKVMMLNQATMCLREISTALLDKKLPMTLSLFPYGLTQADLDMHVYVAQSLVNYISDFLVTRAKGGVLEYMNVVDSAMFGLTLVKQHTEPGIRLLQVMGEAAKLLHNNPTYAENKNLQFVYGELIQRIRQVAQNSPRKDPQAIQEAAKSILDSLGEPEFEKKQSP